jgi:hypothetical protein
MNDLNQLLHDAAGSGDGPRLDPRDLLSSGRRKVRNRRIAVAGGVTAVVVAAAALLAWLPSGDDRPDVVDDPHGRSSSYQEVKLPVEEVERRCSVVLNDRYGTTGVDYVTGSAPDGTAVAGTEVDHFIETREGATALLLPFGERWPNGEPHYGLRLRGAPLRPGDGGRARPSVSLCVVPQTDLMDGIAKAEGKGTPHSPAKLLDTCSLRTGFDIRGWQVLTARYDAVADGLLLAGSTNGYVAICQVSGAAAGARGEDGNLHAAVGPEGSTWFAVVPAPDFGDPSSVPDALDDYLFYHYCSDPFLGAGLTCSGRLPDPVDDHRVEVVVDGDVLAETTTRAGTFDLRADLPAAARTIAVRLVAPDGEIVWDESIR